MVDETQPTDQTSSQTGEQTGDQPESAPVVAKKTTRKRATRKAAPPAEVGVTPTAEPAAPGDTEDKPAKKAAKKTAKRATKKTAKKVAEPDAGADQVPEAPAATAVLFQAPDTSAAPARRRKRAEAPADDAEATPDAEAAEKPKKKATKKTVAKKAKKADEADESTDPGEDTDEPETSNDADEGTDSSDSESGEGSSRRRARRRGGRRRRKSGGGGDDTDASDSDSSDDDTTDGDSGDDSGDGGGSSSRRRRRRGRGRTGDGEGGQQNGQQARNPEDEITALSGSTRLEAKRQRRREGREAGRRRAPIVSEAEFLARRESVDRTMVIRQRDDLTQIGVLEDKVLVEHYVARESQTSLIGNVYLGRVQNVLPSMEAAFIDIGKGRNAVLYAGEVNWTALGAKDGQPRKIESVLSSGQQILVQVSKDPVGHKGARLTSQISLPGRFLVYVPDGTTSGISRKLPDTERNRLKKLLKEIVPESAGVIVRTAAEGASETELTQDVERLTARWSDIDAKVTSGGGGAGAPQLLYGEPDLTLKVVRDLFTEDFSSLVIQGEDAWDLVEGYVSHVAPELRERVQKYDPAEHDGHDLFAEYRLDEQIAKGLDRKVWLPSGGSLIIDRTEAMTVVDVNTGKFTGSGGNLEETVTKNNLEAAEEIVRQLRLRDIGGIVVIDFIDMVLESNRDLVLRRLVECLGRDRTRHQVAEVTSLGLVQMTRKRIGTGLLEAFTEECTHCKGRGLLVHDHPIEQSNKPDESDRRGGRRNSARSGRGRGQNGNGSGNGNGNGQRTPPPPVAPHPPSPADIAAMARPETPAEAPEDATDESPADISAQTVSEVPAETAAAPEPVVEPEVEPEAAAEPETAPEVNPEPVAPVVTTRRRSARRAAGPPAAEPVEHVATIQPVTPVEDSGEEEPPTDEAGEAGESDAPDDDQPEIFHVPVKRKGSRR